MNSNIRTLRDCLLGELAVYKPSDDAEAFMVRDMQRFVLENRQCTSRALAVGHVTASAWIVDQPMGQALLLHHGKLRRWLQPGGHIEAVDATALEAARREAQEETGLTDLRPLGGLFDVDVHEIPARAGEPSHVHYDVRYAFVADPAAPLMFSRESRELAWFPLMDVEAISCSASLERLVAKTQHRRRGAS